jgi:L-lactate dehydrogenase complex protein LldG
MTTTAPGDVEAFRDSLERVDVTHETTTPDGFAAALADAVEQPAVGALLPFDGVSLPAEVDADPSPAALEAAATGVTAAEFGVADYGSVALRNTPDGSEAASLFPELHVVVLRARDVVPDMPAAFERLGDRLRDGETAVLATGPSATADMGDLVQGAHGPERVHVVLLSEGET